MIQRTTILRNDPCFAGYGPVAHGESLDIAATRRKVTVWPTGPFRVHRMRPVTAGEVLATSGFATVYACNERDDVILRTQPESDDVAREVRIHRLLSARGVAPTFFVSYTRDREHTMVLARFHMDLGQWLRLYAPCTVSMWSMRLCRLLREMASCRIFGLDLKPENVLVNLEPGTTIIQDMRLIDFGGGLCWEEIDTISRDGLYACLLIAFHASLFGRFRSLHASRPFAVPLRRLLQSDCIRREIEVVLFQPAIQRLWANLFPGVICTESVADCVQHT